MYYKFQASYRKNLDTEQDSYSEFRLDPDPYKTHTDPKHCSYGLVKFLKV